MNFIKKFFFAEPEEKQLAENEMEKASLSIEKKMEKASLSEESNKSVSMEPLEVIAMSQKLIEPIKNCHIYIADSTITNKYEQLEQVLDKIFSYIKGNPDEIAKIQKYLDYALPSLTNLVKAHSDLLNKIEMDQSTVSAKWNVLEVFDTITPTFENLLESFYEVEYQTQATVSDCLELFHSFKAIDLHIPNSTIAEKLEQIENVLDRISGYIIMVS